jgi:glyoxylase-like metal-dependent hydrolase (beta-lactamase superfamily II)
MMKKSALLFILLLLVLGIATEKAQAIQSTFVTQAEAEKTPGRFDVQRLAEGVYALIRKEPLGLWFEANNVFIVNDDDVVVLDANISAASTKEVLAALRKLTTKPVRYVVNTHWHEDHIIGNWVWREAFPGVEFIGHASALKDLPTVGAANRKQSVEGGPGLIKLLRDQLGQNKSLAGGDLTDEERAGYAETLRLIERYVAEAPGFQTVLPTLTVEDRMTLHRGARAIEIRYLGRAHTAADLIVHLPKENIVIAGDLLVWPVPLIGSTSWPADYAATLENLLALRPAMIVPGHGPVMRDDAYARQMIRMLTSIRQQVEAAIGRGETLEQTRKSVDLSEFRKSFAGDSKFKGFLFANYVAGPAVAAAFRQASTKQ